MVSSSNLYSTVQILLLLLACCCASWDSICWECLDLFVDADCLDWFHSVLHLRHSFWEAWVSYAWQSFWVHLTWTAVSSALAPSPWVPSSVSLPCCWVHWVFFQAVWVLTSASSLLLSTLASFDPFRKWSSRCQPVEVSLDLPADFSSSAQACLALLGTFCFHLPCA